VAAGTRFLAAFNGIEDHLRRVLGADDQAEFERLAQDYAASRHLTRELREALTVFAPLRNAISHGRYYGDVPSPSRWRWTMTCPRLCGRW
jgi:hypothetical protein